MWYTYSETLAPERRRHRGKGAGLLALAIMLCLVSAVVATNFSPAVLAAGSGPIIHWNSNMIYAGQNNGNPWGPVGENVSIDGNNFPPNTQLRLVLTAGDSNNNAALCNSPITTVGTAKTDGGGNFAQNFSWPAAAGNVNKAYSICALLAANGSVVSSHDEGPFTVLSASPPAIDLSSSSVAAGGTVTVTGHNWVPPQAVSVNIASCADCEAGNSEVTMVTAHSSGLNDGSFSIIINIPATSKPANYVVDALTRSGMDANYITGSRRLAITAAASAPPATMTANTTTPSPAATAAATSTPASTASPTAIASNGNTSGSDNGSGGSNGLAAVLIGAIVILLLAIAAVVIFMLLQRRKHPARFATPASQPGTLAAPISHAGYPLQQGNYGPQGQAAGAAAYTQQWPSNYPPGYFGTPRPPGSFPGHEQAMPTVARPTAGNNGYMAPGSYNDATLANVAQCANCGLPLLPNVSNCGRCGTPVSALGRTIPGWSK